MLPMHSSRYFFSLFIYLLAFPPDYFLTFQFHSQMIYVFSSATLVLILFSFYHPTIFASLFLDRIFRSVYDDLLQSDMEHRNLEGDRSGEWNPDSILSQLVEEFSSVSQSSRNRQQLKEINKWKVYWTQLQQLPVYHLDSTMFPRPCISLISIQSPTSSSEFHTDSELPTFLQDTKISSSRRQIFCADI